MSDDAARVRCTQMMPGYTHERTSAGRPKITALYMTLPVVGEIRLSEMDHIFAVSIPTPLGEEPALALVEGATKQGCFYTLTPERLREYAQRLVAMALYFERNAR